MLKALNFAESNLALHYRVNWDLGAAILILVNKAAFSLLFDLVGITVPRDGHEQSIIVQLVNQQKQVAILL